MQDDSPVATNSSAEEEFKDCKFTFTPPNANLFLDLS